MIVIDDVVHHTGDNTDSEHKIPLSRFSVECRKRNNEQEGKTEEFDAVDEGDAIAQFIVKNHIKNEQTPGRKFKAKVVKEQRVEALEPPVEKAKVLASAKKAPAKKGK